MLVHHHSVQQLPRLLRHRPEEPRHEKAFHDVEALTRRFVAWDAPVLGLLAASGASCCRRASTPARWICTVAPIAAASAATAVSGG